MLPPRPAHGPCHLVLRCLGWCSGDPIPASWDQSFPPPPAPEGPARQGWASALALLPGPRLLWTWTRPPHGACSPSAGGDFGWVVLAAPRVLTGHRPSLSWSPPGAGWMLGPGGSLLGPKAGGGSRVGQRPPRVLLPFPWGTRGRTGLLGTVAADTAEQAQLRLAGINPALGAGVGARRGEGTCPRPHSRPRSADGAGPRAGDRAPERAR